MSDEKILVVEDEVIARENMVYILEKDGYKVESVDSGIKAIQLLEKKEFSLVITDLKMKKVDGFEVLKKTKQLQQFTEVLVITGYATVNSAITALKLGAYHYIAKPYKNDEVRKLVKEALLKRALQIENRNLKESLTSKNSLIVGKSDSILSVKEMIAQIAKTDVNVLILGESGTGKELVAKSIHNLSNRAKSKFVAFNCGSFSEELTANELFGHEEGAYTGANRLKNGLIEMADKGTMFLDEVGDMPISMQVKLLRVLQEKELIRVGGVDSIPVNVRFIAATHRDLKNDINQGKFRQDLFYRLKVVVITMPSLSERKEDIPLLAHHFVALKNKEMNKNIKGIGKEALSILSNYSWPGNVRELENVIESAVAFENDESLHASSLPEDIRLMSIETYRNSDNKIPTLEEQEKEYIKWVLKKVGWNKTKASEVIGISRVSLWRKINQYNLEEESSL